MGGYFCSLSSLFGKAKIIQQALVDFWTQVWAERKSRHFALMNQRAAKYGNNGVGGREIHTRRVDAGKRGIGENEARAIARAEF